VTPAETSRLLAAKSPFDHTLQAVCHHSRRKNAASAGKTPLETLEKQVLMDGH
jgi:hypothetical protein